MYKHQPFNLSTIQLLTSKHIYQAKAEKVVPLAVIAVAEIKGYVIVGAYGHYGILKACIAI
jgi:hypothetical protein